MTVSWIPSGLTAKDTSSESTAGCISGGEGSLAKMSLGSLLPAGFIAMTWILYRSHDVVLLSVKI